MTVQKHQGDNKKKLVFIFSRSPYELWKAAYAAFFPPEVSSVSLKPNVVNENIEVFSQLLNNLLVQYLIKVVRDLVYL